MQQAYHSIVIGLGAMGSSTLYRLAQSGKRVLGIDRYHPPHSLGSTHGGSRIIRAAYYEDPSYVPLLQHAYESWAEIEQDSGYHLFTPCGGLMMSSEGEDIASLSAEAAEDFDLPYEWLERKHLKKRYPMFRLPKDTYACLDLSAGCLHPEWAVSAQLELARAAGAELALQESYFSWEKNGQGILVKTSNGSYLTDNLILCLGPWSGSVAAEFGINLEVERIAQHWMQPESGIERFFPGQFPLFLWMVEPELMLYGLPALDGPQGGAKIAFYPYGPHRVQEFSSPQDIHREATASDYQHLREYLGKYVPDLNHQILRSSICMHTNSPDFHPVIAQHPENEQVWAAFGFSGHGFKFSNVVGELLRDLIVDGESEWDLDLFQPDRFESDVPSMG